MLTSYRWLRPIGVAVFGASLAGCSSGGSGNGAGLVSGDVSHFIDQVADEICAAAAQCCPATGHTTPANCAASARAQLHADVDKEIAAGIGLNADAANKCLAAYHDLAPSCPAVWNRAPFEPCKQSLVGTSPPGGPCASGCAPSSEGDVVCETSTTVSPDGGVTTTPSICQVRITISPGGMCDLEGPKAIVHVCDSAAGSWCQNGTCTVPVGVGGSCSNSTCVVEAYCLNGTCTPRAAVGDSCSGSNASCVAGASCDQATMTCRAGDSWKKLCAGDFN